MKSLLVIDDDEDMGDAVYSFLKEQGYAVRLALSGKQGLAFVHSMVPDMIILDWQMPQMGGEQVLLSLASSVEFKKIPVILMSANIASVPAEYLSSCKHLRKPFDIDILIDLIEVE